MSEVTDLRKLTSCFLTGRSSSFVAASSMEGLQYVAVSTDRTPRDIDETYHSSDDEESVKVGVGLRFRFLLLPSSTDATASLSARFRIEVSTLR